MTLAPDVCIQTTLGSSEKLRVRVISSIFAVGGAHILDFVKNTVISVSLAYNLLYTDINKLFSAEKNTFGLLV